MSWMKTAARFGYFAKGFTYILIAMLAMQAATGNGSAESTPGALQSLDGARFGNFLLLAIAAGLGSYALWKLYIVIANPENDGWGQRITALFVSFTNLGFAAEAFTLSLSIGGPRTEGDPRGGAPRSPEGGASGDGRGRHPGRRGGGCACPLEPGPGGEDSAEAPRESPHPHREPG